ncbi:dTDP-glucose 4,6-dehydratase [Conchiformibius kuhniae]|uniref:dTDP-glucose 4,6-dehydratase n=1 Tax=Conchiformibius kuhniae TaxID=211502 RepID=A0A8T9MUK2_9NEIS|nr:dTDP-glucose 4,6-dehydratase [Conchiformibius kuhniae]UOP04794.1 dTDP-glucose 4,6-dehydratase [Conchiformibius kuhniae]
MNILITGGAGFIGSALVRFLLAHTPHRIVNVDKLTYAADPRALAACRSHPRYAFERADVCDAAALRRVFAAYRPQAVVHLAAESHVDKAIAAPDAFVQTNINGTFVLLQTALAYWQGLPEAARGAFRFHHVSTDEVYGDLPDDAAPLTETAAYAPSSPYAASKAAADHLVRAWRRSYGLPVLISHSSNNYGPYQYPEKLIPRTITRALSGKALPVYGDGAQRRDWLFVEDHVRALYRVLTEGRIGESYHIGSGREYANADTVRRICGLLDVLSPRADGASYAAQIRHVADRPGHDRRYAVDTAKIRTELNWRPRWGFEAGLRRTVSWYVDNGIPD